MPAANRSPSRVSTVAAVGQSDHVGLAQATTTPTRRVSETSGRTSHACAGGAKGLETSQLASSRKTSGAPLAMASRQASSSNSISSRALVVARSSAEVT